MKALQSAGRMEIPGTNPKWAAPYFSMWSSQALTLLGSQLVSFIFIWHLTQTTESATVLSVAMLLNLIPQIFLGPFAGVFIDRWSRKAVLISADLLIAISTLSLAVLFAFTGAKTLAIYVWLFLLGLANGIINPSMLAITTSMVPNQHLTRLQGVNQSLQGGLNIIAAPLGAILYKAWMMPFTLLITSLPAFVAIMCLSLIVVPQPGRDGKVAGKILQDMLVSLRYILKWPALCMVIGIAVVINCLDAPAMALVPLLVSKHFNGEALQLGWINSTFSIGIILGGLVLSAWGGFHRKMVTALLGLIGMGVGALLIGIAPVTLFWLAIAGIAIKGTMQSIANAPILSTLQSIVEPAMQGRVMSMVIAVTLAITPFGLLLSSILGDKVSAQGWFIIFGCGSVIFGITGFLIPTLLRLGNPNATAQAESTQ